MSDNARRLRVVRPAPAPRLLEHRESGRQSSVPLRLNVGGDGPLGMLRLGPADLDEGIAAMRAGALPGALVTGIGELPDLTSRARRLSRDVEVPWLVDPLLFKTALPGYRTARHLQTLDYTPGCDADPYEPHDFDDQDLLRRIARNVVGSQLDLGASAAITGCFIAGAPDDRWLGVTAGLLRAGVDARDALAPVPLVAAVAVRMRGFERFAAQRLLVRSLSAQQVDAYLLMLDGVHEDVSAERLAATLRFAALLRASGARVIMGRSGDLRRLLVAFGFDVEYGLGRLCGSRCPITARRAVPGRYLHASSCLRWSRRCRRPRPARRLSASWYPR